MRLILLFCFLGSAADSAASYFAFTSDYPSHFPVEGFQWHSRFEFFRVFDGASKSHAVQYRGVEYEVRFDARTLAISVYSGQKEQVAVSLAPVEKRAQAYLQTHKGLQVPQSLLTESAETPHGKAVFFLEALSIENVDEGQRVLHFKGDLLFSSISKAHSSGQK